MKITNEAVSVARRWDKLFAQIMRERRKHNPNHRRISQLGRDATKTSKRLRRLMGW